MEFLPELLPAEMLNEEPVEEKKTEPNVEMEIKKLNEPPLEEVEPEEETPFEKPKKRRGQPKAKRKPKIKAPKAEVKNMMIYEEPEQAEQEEEEEPPEREDKIEIDPKREKRLENLKKAREARKAKAEYKKKTPKLKPALEPEPSIRETFNTHLLPTEEEKQKIMMEREHYQFMNFMSNMEKYKNFKKGYKMAQMEEELIEKEKQKKTQAKPVQAKAVKKETPSIVKNEEPEFNEYSKYFG